MGRKVEINEYDLNSAKLVIARCIKSAYITYPWDKDSRCEIVEFIDNLDMVEHVVVDGIESQFGFIK